MTPIDRLLLNRRHDGRKSKNDATGENGMQRRPPAGSDSARKRRRILRRRAYPARACDVSARPGVGLKGRRTITFLVNSARRQTERVHIV
jgi:hypothetical protein